MSRIPSTFGSLSEIRWSGTLITSVLAIAIAGGVILAEIPGGWSAVTEAAASEAKFRVFHFGFEPTTGFFQTTCGGPRRTPNWSRIATSTFSMSAAQARPS